VERDITNERVRLLSEERAPPAMTGRVEREVRVVRVVDGVPACEAYAGV
jgi:hypothetical protein